MAIMDALGNEYVTLTEYNWYYSPADAEVLRKHEESLVDSLFNGREYCSMGRRGFLFRKPNDTHKDNGKVVDCFGDEYETIGDMCRAYGTNRIDFLYKKVLGLSFKECLTRGSVEVKDLDGKSYEGALELCKDHGITPDTFLSRFKNGLSLDACLFKGIFVRRTPIVDYDGVEFSCTEKMCEAHHTDVYTFEYKLLLGRSIKDALDPQTPVTDYNGKAYKNFPSMCKSYETTCRSVLTGLRNGYPLDMALTDGDYVALRMEYKDAFGNAYPTLESSLEPFGISILDYMRRRNLGFSLIEIFSPLSDSDVLRMRNSKSAAEDEDFFKGAMRDYVHLLLQERHVRRPDLYYGRNVGYSLTDCFSPSFVVRDHKGNAFEGVKALCLRYDIDQTALLKWLQDGFTLDEIFYCEDKNDRRRFISILRRKRASGIPADIAFEQTKVIEWEYKKSGCNEEVLKALTSSLPKCTNNRGSSFTVYVGTPETSSEESKEVEVESQSPDEEVVNNEDTVQIGTPLEVEDTSLIDTTTQQVSELLKSGSVDEVEKDEWYGEFADEDDIDDWDAQSLLDEACEDGEKKVDDMDLKLLVNFLKGMVVPVQDTDKQGTVCDVFGIRYASKEDRDKAHMLFKMFIKYGR